MFVICIFFFLMFNIYNIALYFSNLYDPERLENENRRITFGDKETSKIRKVFIKDLNYKSNVDLKYFNVYIEKGFWWDPWDIKKSVFKNSTTYPYQVSFKNSDTLVRGIYEIINKQQFDSIDNNILDVCIFLKEPYLKDTITLKIVKFDKYRDSIGYVKIWE